MKEAAQKALDAFKTIRACTVNVWDVDEEIKALEEALAKQEQGGWHTHDLYTDADKNRPDVICDSNGQVTLGLCKRCGRGEAELETPCDKAKQEQGEPYGWVIGNDFYKVQQFRLEGGAYEDQVAVYTTPQPKQEQGEPVEFLANGVRFKLNFDSKGRVSSLWNYLAELDERWVALVAAEDDCHLKLTTPQQRTWVGLTEQEAAECWSTSTVRTWKAIEAKLKEKNAK